MEFHLSNSHKNDQTAHDGPDLPSFRPQSKAGSFACSCCRRRQLGDEVLVEASDNVKAGTKTKGAVYC